MEGRRARRFGRSQAHTHTHTLLPTRAAYPVPSLSSTVSCCYCDYKISVLNAPLFRFGRKHAKCLKLWFSIGVGFSLTALLGVAAVLLWELCTSLGIVSGNANLPTSLLFGFSPSVYGLQLSVTGAAYFFFSTLVSVLVHEFGHALAAASEGIRTEYIAIFVAFLFPGALVAFNYDLLEALQRFNALRVYCAGVWHNAVCCAVCGLVLFILPWILYPFYIHGENPAVLDIPPTSAMFGYLSLGDVIVSLDGKRVRNIHEWMEMTELISQQTHQYANLSKTSEGFQMAYHGKGYCVPTSMIDEIKKSDVLQNQSSCFSDLTEFVPIQCFASSELDYVNQDADANRRDNGHCLNARDVVKLNKCGNGWVTEITNGSNCLCSEDESCLSPVLAPGLVWAEITYSSPFSAGCLRAGRNSVPYPETADSMEHNCGGTFVFVGDLISMSNSVRLTAYQPRWALTFISAHLPNVLEKSLMCTFHVSLTLALLNSLPVYFLDGESMLEVALCHFTSLGPRKRAKLLRACLLGGTLISVFSFTRIFFKFWYISM